MDSIGSKLPNIVYIMADDLGYGDLECYGATKIPTPNIDQIAQQGVIFKDAHSASAVCTPSRYSVITGKYCWRTWLKKWVLHGFGQPLIKPGELTLASMLKEKGYSSAAIGKWHLGLNWHIINEKRTLNAQRIGLIEPEIDFSKPVTGGPTDLGFDYFYGISGSLDMPPYCFIENDHTVGLPDRPKSPRFNQQRGGPMVAEWKDDQVDIILAQKAKEFLRSHRHSNPEKPFFLYHCTAAPHRPCNIQPDFVKGKSQAGDRGDMVILFDWVVGQITDELDHLGMAENTLLIISSDNGARARCANGKTYGHKSNGDWRGQKSDIWEGGHREPFIARWPNMITPNSQNLTPICLVDLMATFADLVGAENKQPGVWDSFSFLSSLLENPAKQAIRPPIIHHSGRGMYSIRKGDWKLVQGLGSGGFTQPSFQKSFFLRPKGQLYNLREDPHEDRNLWKKKSDVVKDLTQNLEVIRERSGV